VAVETTSMTTYRLCATQEMKTGDGAL
jgi:hypothetical protein